MADDKVIVTRYLVGWGRGPGENTNYALVFCGVISGEGYYEYHRNSKVPESFYHQYRGGERRYSADAVFETREAALHHYIQGMQWRVEAHLKAISDLNNTLGHLSASLGSNSEAGD